MRDLHHSIEATRQVPPPVSTGVFVLANDVVARWLSAFVRSFRTYNPELPLCLIPFDESSSECERLIRGAGGTLFREHAIFAELERIGALLETGVTPTGPRWFRRYAAFFGPFEYFAYLDCRMVILGDLHPFAVASSTYDVPLVHYDTAINQVYGTGSIRTMLCRNGLGHGFLSGMWSSRKGLFTLGDMAETAESLRQVRDQMNRRNTDQFFVNYLCDSRGLRTCHLADLDARYAHSAWANDRGSLYEDANGTWRKWDFGGLQHKREVPFVHWAGIQLHPSMPHYKLHRRFRGYRVSVSQAIAERLMRPMGQLVRCLRGNRRLNSFYHSCFNGSART